MLPISSRNSVPPSASSNLPSLRLVAPVKAPCSCPNSSDSRSVSVTAAQLIVMKGAFARGDRRWIAAATSSLPVPRSPSTSTGRGSAAMRSIFCFSSAMAAHSATNWILRSASSRRSWLATRSSRFSPSRRRRSRTCASMRSIFSTETSRVSSRYMSLTRKSEAPALTALTAALTVALPVRMMTGRSGWRARRSPRSSMPPRRPGPSSRSSTTSEISAACWAM